MRKEFKEGFKEEGTPDMKYYAFDWDDNIVHMPTKIILKILKRTKISGLKVNFSINFFCKKKSGYIFSYFEA